MSTQIFISFEEFQEREDKTVNGVSSEFAEANPDWQKDNESNEGCWNCSNCYDCSDCYSCHRCSFCSGCADCHFCHRSSRCNLCSGCSACTDCYDCSGCSECTDCSDCTGCSRCSRCAGCSGCYRCADCSDCSDCAECSRCTRSTSCFNLFDLFDSFDGSDKLKNGEAFPTPILEKIHSQILSAVSAEQALDMSTWHTCETTHCRAGWVVNLAGDAGRALEDQTSTCFAAMQIYTASSPILVSPTRFFETNAKSMADIIRCAKLEQQLGEKSR